MSAKLVYEYEGVRREHELAGVDCTIGRSDTNDIVVPDPGISRRHARLFLNDERWNVEDLGSSNGTQVNGRRSTSVELQNGDTIQLHDLRFEFVEDVPARSGFALTGADQPFDGGGTVLRQAVDFTRLASSQAEDPAASPAQSAKRMERLLGILAQASKSLLSSPDLDEKLGLVLDLVFEHLQVERGGILLWDESKQEFDVRCIRQKGKDPSQADEIRFSRTIALKVFRDKVAVLTTDAQSDDRFAGGESIMALGIRSAMAAPLWNGERVEGLIYVDTPLQTRAFDNFDLDMLSALGNHVAVAIEQSRMQDSIMEQQVVRRRLERYHSPTVVERIANHTAEDDDSLSADQRTVTVLFADVVGFTSRCESMEPTAIAEMLNRYFSVMAEVIFEHEGTLDKFIGDCIMAVFGAPFPTEQHATEAIEAALGMRDALNTVNATMAEELRLQFRVGMHSGPVVAGDIGSIRRSDYTVLGATVNLAARLEGIAKPGQILVSDATAEELAGRYETNFVIETQPKGISRAVKCYEVLGRRS